MLRIATGKVEQFILGKLPSTLSPWSEFPSIDPIPSHWNYHPAHIYYRARQVYYNGRQKISQIQGALKRKIENLKSAEQNEIDQRPEWQKNWGQEEGKVHYYKSYPSEFDVSYLRSILSALPLPSQFAHKDEQERIINLWEESLNELLIRLGEGKENITAIEGQPYKADSDLFNKISLLLYDLKNSDLERRFWERILNLGGIAEYWIEDFFFGCFLRIVNPNPNDENMIRVWQEMLEFAFSSLKWERKSGKIWLSILGIDNIPLKAEIWGKKQRTLVKKMSPYYQRWAKYSLPNRYFPSQFLSFLFQPATDEILLEALVWIEEARGNLEIENHFWYDSSKETEKALADILEKIWTKYGEELRQYSSSWKAYRSLLAILSQRQNKLALHLSTLIESKT